MLDVIPRVDGVPVPVRAGPRLLPVHPALRELLPDGLRQGSTVAVSGAISLLLALLGAVSAEGAWCALVGLSPVSAEAAVEYGVNPSRLVCVADPGARWTTAVGALLDAFDVVAVQPPRQLTAAARHQLAARVRLREVVLVPYLAGVADWSGTDVRLTVSDGRWFGTEDGYGRLRQRRVTVTAEGRGRAARPRSTSLWLPASGGGVASSTPLAPMVELPARRGAM